MAKERLCFGVDGLDGIDIPEFHFISESPFAWQQNFSLKVAVHHFSHILVIAHLKRVILKREKFRETNLLNFFLYVLGSFCVGVRYPGTE